VSASTSLQSSHAESQWAHNRYNFHIVEPKVEKDYHFYNCTMFSGLAKLEQATKDGCHGLKLLLQAMKVSVELKHDNDTAQ